MSRTLATRSGEVGTAAFTLTANTVETVQADVDAHKLEVVSDGAAEVWYTLDGSTPAVDGPASFYLPAAACVDQRDPATTGAHVSTFKFISAGTPKLRIQKRQG